MRHGGGRGDRSADPERPDPWEVALKFLALRSRASAEVRGRLLQAGYGPDEIVAVVARLTAAKYLDDQDFASTWVRSRALRSGYAPARLQRELRAKGVGEAEIAAALDEFLAQRTAREVAEEAAGRKLKALRGLDPAVARRRLVAHLYRQGFSSEIILALCRKYFAGMGDLGEAS